MTHKEFVELYNSKKILVGVSKGQAEKIVISHPKASKYNVPATRFWMYLSFALLILAPIPLWIFKGFIPAVGSVVLGWMIHTANVTSAQQFITKNMLEDKDFFEDIMSGDLPLDDIRRSVIITRV